MQMTKSIEG